MRRNPRCLSSAIAAQIKLMKHSKRRGFTLIELLVVIAIIAILAAILFPVFAQAKRAAKGSVALSSAKQLSLAQLMYSNDYDDNFSPVVEYSAPGDWATFPWNYLQQPYMKSWGILIDPTGPISTQDAAATIAGGDAFPFYGLWGMPPRQEATNGNYSNYTFGGSVSGKAMTGGALWSYDGIGGVANGGEGIWCAYGYKQGSVPSLTTTAIANPADQVMIAQAGAWDFFWQQSNADNFDLYFSSAAYNTYGAHMVPAGPVARMLDSGPAAGVYPWPGPNPTTEPTGRTCFAATDGHAKSVPWRQLMGTTIPIGSRTGTAIKAFWPAGN